MWGVKRIDDLPDSAAVQIRGVNIQLKVVMCGENGFCIAFCPALFHER